MPKLRVNGINAGALIAASDEAKGARRDIGDEATAADGTLRITRQTRKRDLAFRSVPLTAADADAWEALLVGQGEVWSFDASLYGSKGLGPASNAGCAVVDGAAKFGAAKLSVPATTGSIAYLAAINPSGDSSAWTLAFYRSTDSGTSWVHYVVRSDAAKWVAGVRDDAAVTTWIGVSAGTVTISNVTAAAVWYDGLAVLAFRALDAWPAQLAAAAVAFPPLPFIDLDGDLVTEQGARRALGQVQSAALRVAEGLRYRLEVELRAR